MARARLINEVIRSVAVIPDAVVRSVYIRECSRLLDVEEALLYTEVRKILRNRTGAGGSLPPAGAPSRSPRQATPETKPPAGELRIEEEEILRFLLRYCKIPLFEQEGENPGDSVIITVGEFILSQLEEAELVSNQHVFKTIVEETAERMDDPDFMPEKYFIYHHDREVSQTASTLLAEKWVESKRWSKAGAFTEKESEVLDWLIPKIVNEFKLMKIKEIHMRLEEEIGEMQKSGDDAHLFELLAKIQNLKKMEKFLSDKLGNRAIT